MSSSGFLRSESRSKMCPRHVADDHETVLFSPVVRRPPQAPLCAGHRLEDEPFEDRQGTPLQRIEAHVGTSARETVLSCRSMPHKRTQKHGAGWKTEPQQESAIDLRVREVAKTRLRLFTEHHQKISMVRKLLLMVKKNSCQRRGIAFSPVPLTGPFEVFIHVACANARASGTGSHGSKEMRDPSEREGAVSTCGTVFDASFLLLSMPLLCFLQELMVRLTRKDRSMRQMRRVRLERTWLVVLQLVQHSQGWWQEMKSREDDIRYAHKRLAALRVIQVCSFHFVRQSCEKDGTCKSLDRVSSTPRHVPCAAMIHQETTTF